MWRTFCAIGFIALGCGVCASAESIYRTTAAPLPGANYGSNETYTFVAPYFTEVQTMVSVSIAKVAAANSTTKSPSILHAKWDPTAGGQMTYAVSCDLTSIVSMPDKITITGTTPKDYSVTDAEVTSVQPTAMVATAKLDKAPQAYKRGGTISGVNCPPPADSFSVTFTVTPVGKTRGYLYLRRNAFYSDSVNVGVGNDGLLSSSDSSSAQQITAILNELAQTLGAFEAKLAEEKTFGETQQQCYSKISGLVKSLPYYNAHVLQPGEPGWSIPLDDEQTVWLTLEFQRLIRIPRPEKIPAAHDGLVAFFPVPAAAAIYCTVGHPDDKGLGLKDDKGLTPKPVVLSAPTVVSLYTERHVLDPQRDFLTNPQDTFSFSAGIITGHKYTDQSPAKTIVDTLTGPIRALMPSVQVTQTTQVQTAGGKVTQTTNSTATQTGPPKGP